jgi:uncharacterized protein YndB with AHSA1/START domain
MTLGTLTKHGDLWQLRFERPLTHPRERVWRAITDEQDLSAWFPDRIIGQMAAGATLTYDLSAHNLPNTTGEIRRFEPPATLELPAILELTWGGDVLLFELVANPGGSTTLTLTVTFEEVGKAARDGAGWHECLDRLGDLLDGRPSPSHGEVWAQTHPLYTAALGPEASTIGPPPGY